MMLRLTPVAMTMTEEVCCKSCADHVTWLFTPSFPPPPEYGGFGSVSGKIETDIKINHEGEVNR